MSTKQKARREPGKDESSEILAHCAACGAQVSEGERVAYCVIPVGLTFSGGIIGEKLPVCSCCATLARSSAEGESRVNEQIVGRWLGPGEDVNGGAGEEPEISSPGGWVH